MSKAHSRPSTVCPFPQESAVANAGSLHARTGERHQISLTGPFYGGLSLTGPFYGGLSLTGPFYGGLSLTGPFYGGLSGQIGPA